MATVTNNALNREIGELKTRMDSNDERLKRMEDKIDHLVSSVASSKGGMKMLITLGTVVAGVTASVSELIHFGIGRH
jgi:hypothetical protein